MQQDVQGTTTLADLLTNSIVLSQLAPYLSISSVLSLSATSKTLRTLLLHSPDAFRYIDLSRVKAASLAFEPVDRGGNRWRSQPMDMSLTEDDFYSGPLRGIFYKLKRQEILQNVQVLVLDGLSVPAELIQEIISTPRFNVRILSIREAQHLNDRQLIHALKYAVRPSRPEGTPRLKGLYVFGPKDSSMLSKSGQSSVVEVPDAFDGGVMSVVGAQIGAQWNERSQYTLKSALTGIHEPVYLPSARIFKKPPMDDWVDAMIACEGIISFDAVLCRGPRHNAAKLAQKASDQSRPDDVTNTTDPNNTRIDTDEWLRPAIATIALGPNGCRTCHSSPEGPAHVHSSPAHHLPLVGQPPTHSVSIKHAQIPHVLPEIPIPPLFLRCEGCLRGRWCERCSRWWCEDCFSVPGGNRRDSEVSEDGVQQPATHTKIFSNLCIEHCLVEEMMSGAGSGGMLASSLNMAL